jgi:peptidoglycan/LPS O-acetylase OafA/YrhL
LNFVRAKQVVLDSIWASAFAANVRFSRLGVDYFAQGRPPSAIQHFWSLAVEEQFYLVWPAVVSLALFGFLLRRRSRSRSSREVPLENRSVLRLLVVISVATVASLAWSIHATRVAPTSAYFSALARAWELGLGAMLAIGASGLERVPARSRAVAGWLGLAAIVAAAVSFSGDTPFPGSAALLPTVGAALVIGAGIGAGRSRVGVGRLLSIAPARYVGDRSYAFYLWHWPVLVIAALYLGHSLSVALSLLLLAGAFLLSVVSYRLVEDPIRRSRWSDRSSALLWPVSVGAVLLVAGWTLQSIDVQAARLEAAAAGPAPQLSAPSASATSSPDPNLPPPALPDVVAAVRAAQAAASLPSGLRPPVSRLTDDWHRYACPAKPGETTSAICRVGATSGGKTMVVIGDSHMEMWMPAILAMASRDGWVVIPLIKPGCVPDRWVADHPEGLPIGSLHVNGKPECILWFQWTVQQVKSLHPDVTVVGGSLSAALRGPTTILDAVKGIRVGVSSTKQSSKDVIVIGDPLGLTFNPVDCLLAPQATMGSCTGMAPIQGKLLYQDVAKATRRAGGGFLDTTGWFCFEDQCPVVVGHTITRLDGSHVTVTYATELSGVFRTAFRALIG